MLSMHDNDHIGCWEEHDPNGNNGQRLMMMVIIVILTTKKTMMKVKGER